MNMTLSTNNKLPRSCAWIVAILLILSSVNVGVQASSSAQLHPRPFFANVEVSTKTDKQRGWPAWWPKKKNQTNEAPKETSDTNQQPAEPKQKKLPFFRRPSQSLPTEKPPIEKRQRRKGKKDTPKESSRPSKQPNVTTSAPSSTNQTAPTNTTAPQQQPQQPQPQPAGMIVMGQPMMGGPPPQYRYYSARRGMPAKGGPQAPTLASQNNLILAEIALSVVSTVARLALLQWLARRLAGQEESIQPTQHFVWELVNDRFTRDDKALTSVLRLPPPGVSASKWKRRQQRARHLEHKRRRQLLKTLDLDATFCRTVVVVPIQSDSKGGLDVDFLADTVTFLLQQHRNHAFGTDNDRPKELETVFLVQSPGGAVATYGLAAAQLRRLQSEEGITTTVCVDKYAASGGYMIASQGDKLIAAPFATIGSIGVIAEGLNFYDLAKRHGILPLTVKAGKSKNLLSSLGPVTQRDLNQEKGRLEKVHTIFQELVEEGRPVLKGSMDVVGDGSVFLGVEAKDLQLVDSVMTSDEYLFERVQAGDRVLKLHRSQQAKFSRKVILSPRDILPHLQSWFSEKARNMDWVDGVDIGEVVYRVVQAGSWLSFAQHVVRQYFGNDPR